MTIQTQFKDEDLAYANLQFFSEYAWQDDPEHVPNGEFQNEWYRLLQPSTRSKRFHIEWPREHAKTTCTSVIYIIWRLGRDPNLRVLIVSKSATLATNILREIKRNIEINDRIHRVFPNLQPDSPWSDSEIQVKRTVIRKDPTVRGVGLHGSLTGARADILILDDPFDEENVMTLGQRSKVENWIEKVAIPVLTPDGETIAIGCLVEGTKILMENGTWKNIEDVVVEERVISFDSVQTVEAVIPQGIADVYELKTKNHTIEATANHPFLVCENAECFFIRLKDLEIGGKIISFQYKSDGKNPENYSHDDLWALGYMFGDGWITRTPNNKGSMRWATCVSKGVYNERNERILRYFKSAFDVIPKLTPGRYYRTDVARVGRYFEKVGLIGKAKTKRVPPYVFSLPVSLRRSFLDGFIAADGHINKDKTKAIELCNRSLVKDLKLLAMISGYRTNNIYERIRIQQPPHSPKPIEFHSYHISIGHKEFLDKFRPVEIKSIKYIGKKPVYDLTISKTRNFVADGLVVHNTRWHHADYWGTLLEKADDDGKPLYESYVYQAVENPQDKMDDWKVLWPEKWSAERLYIRRLEIGRLRFNCLYQNDPSGYEGVLFREEDLTFYDPDKTILAHLGDLDYYMGVDPSISEEPTADYFTICRLAVDRKLRDVYVLDIFAERLGFPAQVKKIDELYNANYLTVGAFTFPKEVRMRKVGIESVAYQRALQQAVYTRGLPVVEVKHSKRSKIQRMIGLQPHFENGRIKFPSSTGDASGVKPRWWEAFKEEYLSFPRGRHDDRLDALQIAFEIANVVTSGSSIPFGPGASRQPLQRWDEPKRSIVMRMPL